MKLIFVTFFLTIIAIVRSATLNNYPNTNNHLVRRHASQIKYSNLQNTSSYIEKNPDNLRVSSGLKRDALPY